MLEAETARGEKKTQKMGFQKEKEQGQDAERPISTETDKPGYRG